MSLTQCKIIGDNVDYGTYSAQTVERGDKAYIMSRSELVEFFECPAKWILGPQPDDGTPSTNFGSLVDCLVTSVEKFDSLFAVAPATYPGAKGEEKPWTRQANYCKEWEAERVAEGRTVIKADVKEQADLAVTAILADSDVSELLRVSRKQVHIAGIWKDKDTGLEVPIRGLLDLVPPKEHPVFGKTLADFKTCRNGSPAQWARVVDDQAYDVQASLFFDLYIGATNEDRTDFIHAVQENVAPFHVVKPMPSLSSEFLQWGRAKYQAALKLYAQCLKTGVWPSYPVAGLPFGPLQIIGPDSLWSYRQMAGQGSLDRSTYQPEPEPPADEKGDLTP